MEAVRSSEILVTTNKTTLLHSPEDHILHFHRQENLKL
jgi:hypothetical protein